MGREFDAKVFKSGNSLAIRMPRDLGLMAGEEMSLLQLDGRILLWRKSESKARFLALAGTMSAGFMAEGRDATGDPSRDWSARPSESHSA